MTAGVGVAFVAASIVSPLVLKTTPSDLDLYFWPSAETIVNGHPLLIYSAHLRDVYPNANGPLGLVPLIPVVALADALGWASTLAGRAAMAGAVVSLAVLLLAYQVVGFTASARGGVRHPLGVASTVLLAPALWIAVLDYGHVEQPIELCLVLFAISCLLSDRNVLSGIALGAAVLARTIAGFCLIPLMFATLATRRIRPAATIVLSAAATIGVGLIPFFLADANAVTHSLITYRGSLPIGGGSFVVIAREAAWAGLVRGGDVYIALAVALVLTGLTLRRKPAVATSHAGLAGLVTVASCCFPLFAKTVFPYYLLEPYVFATLWWLGRPGSARTWRAVVPALLTVDVFIVKAASISPFSAWGILAGITSSTTVALAVALVTFDLLRSPEHAGDQAVHRMRSPQTHAAVQEAR
ncbi:MAG: hypothetical protein ACHQ4F_06215 [Candidatus Dormibacteria bacterium]